MLLLPSLLRGSALKRYHRPFSQLSDESVGNSKVPLLQLGHLKLQSNVILSPLERISDVGFRNLCYQQGAGLTWTEMIHCSGLLKQPELPGDGRGAFGPADLIDTHDPDTLTGVQLIVDRTTARDGWGTDLLWRALKHLEEGAASTRPEWNHIAAVDLNFGCPAPDISRRGAGPAQLRRRSKIKAIFEVLEEWKQSTSLKNIGAVGAKIRLGNTAREQHFQVYLPVAEAAADVGLDYLVVHARNGDERSSDPPTWPAIAQVKDLVAQQKGSNLKVIGNGDIRSPGDVKSMKEMTNCDGFMIGRAAMRNPWCFPLLACGSSGSGNDAHCVASNKKESEWPNIDQVEEAYKQNTLWSSNRNASVRYLRFREENFERLRTVALEAHHGLVSTSTQTKPDGIQPSVHSDWYTEWSQASAKRRHLDRLDDIEQGSFVQKSETVDSSNNRNLRRTSNSRDWKRQSRGRRREGKKKSAEHTLSNSPTASSPHHFSLWRLQNNHHRT